MNICRYIFLGLIGVILFMSSCNKEEVTTKETMLDPFLIDSIVYNYEFGENPRRYTASFEYNTDDIVTAIADSRPGYYGGEVKYDEEGRVDTISVLLDPAYTKYTAFEYEDDLLKSMKIVELGGFVGLTEWTYNFEYDSDGQLKEKTSLYNKNDEFMNVYKYRWKNGNISAVDNFGTDGEIISTTDYTYDDKLNYAKHHIHFIGEQNYWNKNNVIRSVITDFSGLIDTYCLDCTSEIEYDGEGRPKVIKAEWLETTEIFYH